jgi:hypothetical protein
MDNFKLMASSENVNKYHSIISGQVYEISISNDGKLLNIELFDTNDKLTATVNRNIEFGTWR